MMNGYKVVTWDDRKVLAEFINLKHAKIYAKREGHTDWNNGKWYAPVAYVEDTDGYCVYNPRFKKEDTK